jgi:type II secretory pathway pseudopilin PulG
MSKKTEKSISLIALILTIIVIIILAGIVISSAINTPEAAGRAKYKSDLSEIQQAVSITRTQNLAPTTDGTTPDINNGFTKIMLKKTPVSALEDGWVVNLDTINIRNSTWGNAYSSISPNSEITFGTGAPDIYVYDSNGVVYYAPGFSDMNTKVFSQNYSSNEWDNQNMWSFDTNTGTISRYLGGDVTELIVPDYINGVKVNSIIGDTVNHRGIVYDKVVQTISISEGITALYDYAFAYCKSIERVNLPNSLISIGANVFSTCLNLSSINIPNNVTSIGASALSTCPRLVNLTIPNRITTLEAYCFSGSGLTSITIPSNITLMRDSVFNGCRSLKSIVIPNSVTDMGANAFNNCIALESAVISNKTTTLKTSVFGGCTELKNVVIPEGVISIVNYAFTNCKGLTNLTIPSSITSIANYAFYQCTGITQITVNKAQGTITGTPPWGATNANVSWSI